MSVVERSYEEKNEAQNLERLGRGVGVAGGLISIVVEAELRVQRSSDTTNGEGATCLLQNY